MRNGNKAVSVVGTIPRKYEWLYFIKHKNDIHPPVPLWKLAIGHLVYELSQFSKIKGTHLMDF